MMIAITDLKTFDQFQLYSLSYFVVMGTGTSLELR